MKIKTFEQLDDCEKYIKMFEAHLGETLPHRYREFLSLNNVCSISPESILDFKKESIASLQVMFGFYHEPEVDDNFVYTLSWNHEIYQNRIHHDYLAIGCDYFGNCICIALSGNKLGKIYFWNHEAEENQHNLILLADDFDSFLESLHE